MTTRRTLAPGRGHRTRISLRLLQTTDLHGNLRGYDYFAERDSETIGLARTATLIDAARATAKNLMLFDTGDFLQGSPVCDVVAQTGLGQGHIHPVVAAMNLLQYDAVTPGNHDFNHGADFLLQALADARFPVICANLFRRATGAAPLQTLFAPRITLQRDLADDAGNLHPVRIAVIGCLPPQTIDWDHHLAVRFETSDMVDAVRSQVSAARAETCDIVVVLAHSGIDLKAPSARAENAIVALTGIDGVDVVMGGHTHSVFPNPDLDGTAGFDVRQGTINGAAVVMAGFWGNHLGQVDLCLEPAESGGWQVAGRRSCLTPVMHRDCQGQIDRTTLEAPDLVRVTDPAHTATLDYIRRPVGCSLQPLHSFFSLIANDAAVQLVAAAQAGFVRHALADTPLADLPVLSAAAPSKTGRRSGPDHFTHIPAGPLTHRDIADLYHYPNTICAVKLDGDQLHDWLEHSASLFSHFDGTALATDAPALLNDAFPGYKFDVITGVEYQIDLRQPPRFNGKNAVINPDARRVRNLRWQGRAVTGDMEFIVATNSFRAYGIGFADGPGPAPQVVLDAPRIVREIVLDHVLHSTPLDLPPAPVWRFAPLGGQTALYLTSPAARPYLADPGLPPIEDLGDTDQGFACLRLHL